MTDLRRNSIDPATTATPESIDPVTLEILWTRLVAVANEQAAALMRTSFTPIVRDIGDLSAAVFDPQGRMAAQAVTGTPGHINGLATGMRHFLAAYPATELVPGDVLITNDPWATTGQLNDISVVTPVFSDSTLLGFMGNCCHAIDIGGRGLSAEASEIYEEGLQIPILKLFRAGKPNDDLMRLIRSNVRAPDEVLGDLHAQVAANEVGAAQLRKYLAEFGFADLSDIASQIIERTEAAMRRAIAALPDGRYEKTLEADGLGERITIRTAIEVRGEELVVDLAGSSAQVNRGLNAVLNYVAAYTHYALKCALCPAVPHNEGSFRPITVTAPEGSIFNPRYPAPVAGRHIPAHIIPHAIFGALLPILPSHVIAEGAGTVWLCTVRGQGNDRFVSVFFSAGGTGARPASDGLSATGFPSGVAAAPVEMIEADGPLLIRRKELRPDSGGAGKLRGGLGQTIEVELRADDPAVVSVLCDRLSTPAQGYSGGASGATARVTTSADIPIDPRRPFLLQPRARFTLELPGGGGFFDPREREPDKVAMDVAEGLVTSSAAKAHYGWTPDTPRVGATAPSNTTALPGLTTTENDPGSSSRSESS